MCGARELYNVYNVPVVLIYILASSLLPCFFWHVVSLVYLTRNVYVTSSSCVTVRRDKTAAFYRSAYVCVCVHPVSALEL